MEAIQSLRQIGLSEKEAKIYLALLQLGRATAYSVSTKAGLKRPTTYVVLDELIKAGFVYEIPQSAKKMYEAMAPEEVFALARERMRAAETALPSIQSLMRKKQGKTQTLYFEGLAGLEQALKYRANDARNMEFVGFYAAAVGASKEAVTLASKWFTGLKKNNIRVRGFVPKDEFLSGFHASDAEYQRNFKALSPKDYSSKISIDTVGDFVRIIDIVSPIPQATIIENAEVAKTLREIFERMWKLEATSSL